jgi:hypothetical protein
MRARTFRCRGHEWEGREWRRSRAAEVIASKLARKLGPHHREVHKALRQARELREEEFWGPRGERGHPLLIEEVRHVLREEEERFVERLLRAEAERIA